MNCSLFYFGCKKQPSLLKNTETETEKHSGVYLHDFFSIFTKYFYFYWFCIFIKYWNRENFQLPVFNGFTRFWDVMNTISLFFKKRLSVCDTNFVAALEQKLMGDLHEILYLVAS